MIIGGNTSFTSESTPIWAQPAPTFGGGGANGFGSGGAFFSGTSGVAPFNPYAGNVAYNPYNAPGHNPFVAPNGLGNQVVYAHYGPGQAIAGQNATASAPAAAATPAAAAEEKKADEKKAEEKKPEGKTVTVASGDSLSKIARANGTTWQKLYEANKDAIGSNPNLIRPGLVLKMP